MFILKMGQETLWQNRMNKFAVELIPLYCAYINDTFCKRWISYWNVEDFSIDPDGETAITKDIERIAFFAGFIDKIFNNEVLSGNLFDKIVGFCIHFCKQAFMSSSIKRMWDLEIERQVKEAILEILDHLQARNFIEMEIQRGRDNA